MPFKRSGVGFVYVRGTTESGYMVVMAKDNNGIIKCGDYKLAPPDIKSVLPEHNIK